LAPSPELANGGFELLQERPPQSLLRRFFVTQQHLFGLLFGGGVAFVRDRSARGQGASLLVFTIRLLLLPAWLFLDKRIVRQPFPVQVRMRLESLGPTYIKLGQILSLRQDILPKVVTDELQNLLDRLPVVPFARFQELVEADLARPMAACFASVDPTPLGSASLAQTHRAILWSGEHVVLKVIKPAVRETIERDVTLLRMVGRVLQFFLARYQPQRIINEFCAYTLREVDLRFEADNAETFIANFEDRPEVHFPHIYREFSGRDVLCMEFFAGTKPTVAEAAKLTASDRSRFLDLGVSSIVQMLFGDGFFHADLHPGNMMFFPDLSIGFIDLGMVGRLDESTRKAMLYYFHSLVMGDPENAARILTTIAVAGRKADLNGLRRELTDLNRRWASASQFHRFSIAQLVLQSINVAGRYWVYYPEEIILMTKALVTIEGVATLLEPNLELTTLARGHIQQIIRGEFDLGKIWRKGAISAPELFDAIQNAPMILAHMLQQVELNRLAPHTDPFQGLKEMILAGFLMVAVALLVLAGTPWWLWGALLILAVGLALRSLR
jgi:ubiquinone biosynthesis protein